MIDLSPLLCGGSGNLLLENLYFDAIPCQRLKRLPELISACNSSLVQISVSEPTEGLYSSLDSCSALRRLEVIRAWSLRDLNALGRLKGLKGLAQLRIRVCNVTSLRPLSSLTALEELNVYRSGEGIDLVDHRPAGGGAVTTGGIGLVGLETQRIRLYGPGSGLSRQERRPLPDMGWEARYGVCEPTQGWSMACTSTQTPWIGLVT